MKSMKKFMALVVSVILSLALFTGCDQSTDRGAGAPSNPDTSSKAIVVGTNAEFPPFEFIDDKGQPDGFDIALIKECAKISGVEVKIENMEFKSLIGAMETGKIQMIASGMTITDERKQSVDFTDSYYTAVQKIILLKGDTSIKGVADLNGKRIGVQEGTTGDFIATNEEKEADGVLNAKVSRYKKGIDAVNDLKNKRIDCVLIDKNPSEEYVKVNPDAIYAIDSGCEPESYGFAVTKANKALLTKINAALKTLKENGTYDKLIKQYIND